MNVLDQALKSLKEAYRQPRNLFLTLGLPVVFMLIFGFAFGGEDDDAHDVAVLDLDNSTTSRAYVAGLAGLRNDDGSLLVNVVNVTDEAAARAAVERRDHQALVIVPADLSEDLAGCRGAAATTATVTVVGDPSFQAFGISSSIIDAYTRGFGERFCAKAPPLEIERSTVTANELTNFDFIAPGLMVFAILNLIPGAGSTLAREVELGTIDRLRQSPARAWTILGGVTLAQLAISAVSLALMLVTALLLGFHNQGSYLVAYGVGLTTAVSVVGIGMIVAAFVRSQQEAATMGTILSVPASFLSGAFFPIPKIELFELAGRTVDLYMILPTTHAVSALRSVMTLGRGVGDVVWELTALAVLTVLYFGAGVWLYRRMRLAPA